MRSSAFALAALIAASAEAEATTNLYSVSGLFASGTFTLSCDKPTFSNPCTLSSLSLVVGSTLFDTSNASLAPLDDGFGNVAAYLIGANANGVDASNVSLDDFSLGFIPDLPSQSAPIAYFPVVGQGVQFGTLTIVEVAATVPEPSTWAMMLLGFVGIASTRARRWKAQRSGSGTAVKTRRSSNGSKAHLSR